PQERAERDRGERHVPHEFISQPPDANARRMRQIHEWRDRPPTEAPSSRLLAAWRIPGRSKRSKRTLIDFGARRSARGLGGDAARRKRSVELRDVFSLLEENESVGDRLAVRAAAEIAQERGDAERFG